ncbi:G-box-binding factor 4 [Rhodamnia argentea]|uniref:G-box-binding factor 4 n=1 Tax=Rhodamnia argentea TaxID=178133 RepID=A0A8B8PCT1_9MYRT|nr:G-box-binding factor 4 [Rhodamnia argentea]XP_048129625.1 G-box-binding factor 4 [Rhodamnia argentea]XP_048129627.1 G-box-binding factor 4 [Rhodamnia argentea]
MASSKSRESDPSRRLSLSSSSSSLANPVSTSDLLTRIDRANSIANGSSAMTARNASAPSSESTLLDASVAPAEPPAPLAARTVDDVWREIVAGQRRECKEEMPDEMMTLEDFLVKAGASVGVEEEEEEEDVEVKVKVNPAERMGSMGSGAFAVDAMAPSTIETVEGSIVGFGNGVDLIGVRRGKRGACVLEPLDKAAQQRQRRMIKNRESAARSRERKQAYQVELESLAVRLEEENEQLLKEKAERTKERFRQLMEKVVPIVEKPKTARVLRRVQSLQW